MRERDRETGERVRKGGREGEGGREREGEKREEGGRTVEQTTVTCSLILCIYHSGRWSWFQGERRHTGGEPGHCRLCWTVEPDCMCWHEEGERVSEHKRVSV